MASKTFSDYDSFARLYNKYWGDEFVKPYLDILKKTGISKRLTTKSTVLDLCCGTGQLAQALSLRGYQVTGIDGSEQMLQFARGNAPHCKFIHSDARSFDLKDPVDLAVSAYDSLNHLMNLQELTQVFRNVHSSTKERAWFVFDMNMDEGLRARWRGTFGIVGDDHAAVVRNHYDPKHKIAKFDITMFFRKGESWNRSDLTLQERCYSEKQIKSVLQSVGFDKVSSYDAQRDLKLRGTGRTFFVCRK